MTTALSSSSPAPLGFVDVAVQTFEGIDKLAQLMARMGTMPAHLVGKPADCFRVVVQAAKWRMDPFAVAECTSLVHGRMCYEGKLVAAVLTSLGAIEGRLEYVTTGSGQNASIAITGTPRGGKPVTLNGSVKDWRTNGTGSPWDKQPEVMLVYRGTRQWARMYAPEALLGVYTPDEFDQAEPTDISGSAVVSNPEAARTGDGEVVKDGVLAPEKTKEPKKAPAKTATPVHPAVEASRKLWDELGKLHNSEVATKIVNRIAGLNGAAAPVKVAPEYLEQMAKDVAEVDKRKADLASIDDWLAEAEAAQKANQ